LLEIVLSCFDLLVRELQSDFTSSGTLCSGWLYVPEGVTLPPVIVLAHGISLTHSFHFWGHAEAYATAGLAVFDFDPRFTGGSDGEPRQMSSVRGWREDLVAVVAHVRSLEVVDASRVVLIGMSLGGGLVVLTSLMQSLLAGLADNHAVYGGSARLRRAAHPGHRGAPLRPVAAAQVIGVLP
jgi:uncharacterized protein